MNECTDISALNPNISVFIFKSFFKVASAKKIEDRTKRFITEYDRLSKDKDFPTHDVLASIIGVKSKGTITEILGQRQNIQPDQWERFKSHFGLYAENSAQKPSSEEKDKMKGTDSKYLELLESNDHFFKTEYAKILSSLEQLIVLGMKQEALIKLNLQHTGVIEAMQKGEDADEIQAQINSQIAEIGPYGQKDNDDGK